MLEKASGPFHRESATICDFLLRGAGVGDSGAKRRTENANSSLSYETMVLEEVERI